MLTHIIPSAASFPAGVRGIEAAVEQALTANRLGAGRVKGRIVIFFTDTIINRIDAKGRVSVPASFREVLAAENAQHLFLIRSVRHDALEGFGPSLAREQSARLESYDLFGEEGDALATNFFADMRRTLWDTEGRIKIPEEYLAHAKLTSEVAFVGLGRKFQIWNPEAHRAWRERALDIERKAKAGRGQGGA